MDHQSTHLALPASPVQRCANQVFVRWSLVLSCALVLLVSGITASHASNPTKADAPQKLIMNDGSVLIGVVKKSDKTTLWLQTSRGLLKIKRDDINNQLPADSKSGTAAKPTTEPPPARTTAPQPPARTTAPQPPARTTAPQPPARRETTPPPVGRETSPPRSTNDGVELDRYDRYDRNNRRYRRDRRYRRGRRYRRDRYDYRGRRPMYYRTRNSRRGFLVAGIVMLSTGYGVSLITGLSGYSIASGVRDGKTALDFGMLMVPVAGPFITWGLLASRYAASPGTYPLAAVAYPWLGILGLVQGLGTAFIIVGATGKKTRVPVYARDQGTPQTPMVVAPAPSQAVDLGRF